MHMYRVGPSAENDIHNGSPGSNYSAILIFSENRRSRMFESTQKHAEHEVPHLLRLTAPYFLLRQKKVLANHFQSVIRRFVFFDLS